MDWWEFFFVLLVVLPITVLWLGCIIDAIARPDLSGWIKAAWVLGILILPLIGSLVYIITRPAIVIGRQTSAMDQTWGDAPDSLSTSTSRVDSTTNMPI
jgi:hypothetical protein